MYTHTHTYITYIHQPTTLLRKRKTIITLLQIRHTNMCSAERWYRSIDGLLMQISSHNTGSGTIDRIERGWGRKIIVQATTFLHMKFYYVSSESMDQRMKNHGYGKGYNWMSGATWCWREFWSLPNSSRNLNKIAAIRKNTTMFVVLIVVLIVANCTNLLLL
jgi:hypothetical protein